MAQRGSDENGQSVGRKRSSGLLISLLILVFVAIAAMKWHERQEIKSIEISGATDLSLDAVHRVLDSCKNEEHRALVLSEVRDDLESIPFVRSAIVNFCEVRGLSAEVTERTPVAHVVLSDGSLRYVDAEGVVLPATTDRIKGCIPIIRGVESPLANASKVKSMVRVLNAAKENLDKCLYGEVSEFVLERDGTIRVLTDRITWRLGRPDVANSTRSFADMNVFWTAIASADSMPTVQEIDLRWQNSVVLKRAAKT